MPLGAPTEIREEHAEKINMVHAESCMCIYVRVGRGWGPLCYPKTKTEPPFLTNQQERQSN